MRLYKASDFTYSVRLRRGPRIDGAPRFIELNLDMKLAEDEPEREPRLKATLMFDRLVLSEFPRWELRADLIKMLQGAVERDLSAVNLAIVTGNPNELQPVVSALAA